MLTPFNIFRCTPRSGKKRTTKRSGVAYLNISRRLREEKGVEYGFDAGQPPHKVSLVIPILGQAERLHRSSLSEQLVLQAFFYILLILLFSFLLHVRLFSDFE